MELRDSENINTWTQSDVRLAIRRSSKCVTVRLSVAALRFRGTAGLLKGSPPESLKQGWQRKPGPDFAAIVYLVYSVSCERT